MRKLTGSLFIRGVVFAWLKNAEASIEELARSVSEQGGGISAQGLEQRFTEEAAELAKGVLEEAVAQVIQVPAKIPIELLKRFKGVYLTDCSKLSLPKELAQRWPGTGKKGEADNAQLKLEVMLELSEGALNLNLLPGRTHDSRGRLANMALEADSLRIHDLAYWDLERMEEQDRRGELWLSRYKHGTHLSTAGREAFDLPRQLGFLEKQNIEQTEYPVILGRLGRLKARLIVQRMPQEIAARRRSALKQSKASKGQCPSKAQLILRGWMVLVTNAAQEKLCADEALICYGARWQIELLFKLWKSHAKISQSRSNKPWRRLCEIYCKLLGAVIQHWISLAGTWNNPRRSLLKAAHVVTEYAKIIALALSGKGSLLNALHTVTAAMQLGCNQNSRRKQPNTWLTLLLYLLPWGLT